jgi:hypothetical protein
MKDSYGTPLSSTPSSLKYLGQDDNFYVYERKSISKKGGFNYPFPMQAKKAFLSLFSIFFSF